MLSNLLWWPWHGIGTGVVPPVVVGQPRPGGRVIARHPINQPPVRDKRRKRIFDEEEEAVIAVILSEE